MRVMLTGGGTGGHIYPALAFAKQIKKEHPDAELLYVGTSRGLEAEIVPREGIPFESIEITGFKRKLSFHNLRTLYLFLKGVHSMKKRIRSFRPDMVVGTGGYVAGPVVYAASRMSVPTMIHEQNVIPGLTNQFLARFADRICVSFAGSAKYFPEDKVVVTGNPRATDVKDADPIKGRQSLHLPHDKKIVLIAGGSRGAEPINEAVLSVLPDFEREPNIHFIYVTGDVHYEKMKEQLGDLDQLSNVTIRPFLYNMPEVLAATDLIVNRAGASFLAEITSLGIPSILIPSPYVTNNHQEKNARWMEEQGASVMVLERDLEGRLLLDQIKRILENEQLWTKMKSAAEKMGKPDAAPRMVEEMDRLLS
ncbi:MAG: undecaprenyldiphospho-muramoylpentapeptide beta-N-acetylglucosaminyltransferase [Bacillaceae bacterium]|nr:undecaprenyldiphospho-muramoylpentapeptide beta-N-acetylglucosaminyltransferase [Bacillaceae bacterium]